MTDMADDAAKAAHTLADILRAFANDDSQETLRLLNDTSDGEAHWVAMHAVVLLRQQLEARAKGNKVKARRLLYAAATGMDADAMSVGLEVVIDDYTKREGLNDE